MLSIMRLSTLSLVLTSCLAAAAATSALEKVVITVYVSFGTYNDEDITAWEVMEGNAQMVEGSSFNYKDFLTATVAIVWQEKMEVVESDGEASGTPNPAAGGSPGGHYFKGALKLVDAPLVFGLDVACPDPPGWVPPFPRDAYTCQEFKAALEIEADKDVIFANGGYSGAIAEAETELAVGAHVQHMYVKAVNDGTMERKLRVIEGGYGDMRILWDDPNLRFAWEKYRPQLSYRADGRGGGGQNTRAIVGGALVGSVMFFFLLALCVNGRMSREAAKVEKAADDFDNERAAEETAASNEDKVHRLVIPKSSDEEDGDAGQAENGGGALADVNMSDPVTPSGSDHPPAPYAPDSPESDRAFDLPTIS